ncbi:MAG: DUF983 domain-containing protein [Bacteroidetes bacterium]|nr:DUF983 domain-containing protein [Bacteroidota bacterium]
MNIITGKCPRCEQGEVFESSNPYLVSKMLNTHKRCAHCNLNYIPEIGFYWGATYVAYALTVAFSGLVFVISTIMFGFMNSLNLNYVLVNGILIFILSPVFFRLSRIFWLWMFYERS